MTKQKLKELDKSHYLHPTSSIKSNFIQGPKVLFERGDGIYLYDDTGKQYIDGLSSLWNVNIGHGRKELAEVARQQMEQLAFSHSFNQFSNEPVIMLAEKIASLAPGDLSVCQFTSGGSESNETAFKLARYYFKLKGEANRYKIISRYRGYHGVSMGATSATGIPMFRHMGGPLADGFLQTSAPYSYRCDRCEGGCKAKCAIEDLEALIKKEGPDTIAAFIAEPIQGAGGVIIPPAGYLKAVRDLCRDYGILFIADEVITGFGRTGKWFGVEHEDLVPDILTFAKGITSGYIPLGGVVISEKVHQTMVSNLGNDDVLPHGYTYSGHPTACVVALKNIEILDREGLIENADKMGRILEKGLEKIKSDFDIVGNASSRGLLASVEIVQDKKSKMPFPASEKVASQVFSAAFQKGLITRGISIDQTDIVALCPPLNINESQIETLLAILSESINEVRKRL